MVPSRQKRTFTGITFNDASARATKWIGSNASLRAHTLLFIVAFMLPFLGVSIDRVLLVLTTIVSLEAIYLAIFIQMTVNKNTADIEDIAEDVEDIAEDVDEIEKDIDEIQKDVDEIQEDVEDMEEGEDNEPTNEVRLNHDLEILAKIERALGELKNDIEILKKK